MTAHEHEELPIPYTPAERLNVGHEDIAESGFALVSHVDDPSFVVAVRPRKTPVEDA